MERGVPQGEHNLQVSVSDDLHDTVEATVKVTIHYIEAEKVYSSGSLRLDGEKHLQYSVVQFITTLLYHL